MCRSCSSPAEPIVILLASPGEHFLNAPPDPAALALGFRRLHLGNLRRQPLRHFGDSPADKVGRTARVTRACSRSFGPVAGWADRAGPSRWRRESLAASPASKLLRRTFEVLVPAPAVPGHRSVLPAESHGRERDRQRCACLRELVYHRRPAHHIQRVAIVPEMYVGLQPEAKLVLQEPIDGHDDIHVPGAKSLTLRGSTESTNTLSGHPHAASTRWKTMSAVFTIPLGSLD